MLFLRMRREVSRKKKKVDIKQSQKNELVLLGVLRHSEFVKIAAALVSRANKV